MTRYQYTLTGTYDPDQLHSQLSSTVPALPGFSGLCGSAQSVEVLFTGNLSPADKTRLDALLATYLYDGTYQNTLQRGQAVTLGNDPSPQSKLVRAILLTLLDEINLLRTALALPPRTTAQAKQAVRDKLNSGQAD